MTVSKILSLAGSDCQTKTFPVSCDSFQVFTSTNVQRFIIAYKPWILLLSDIPVRVYVTRAFSRPASHFSDCLSVFPYLLPEDPILVSISGTRALITASMVCFSWSEDQFPHPCQLSLVFLADWSGNSLYFFELLRFVRWSEILKQASFFLPCFCCSSLTHISSIAAFHLCLVCLAAMIFSVLWLVSYSFYPEISFLWSMPFQTTSV